MQASPPAIIRQRHYQSEVRNKQGNTTTTNHPTQANPKQESPTQSNRNKTTAPSQTRTSK